MNENLTLQNFTEVTGRRFRVSRDQQERIAAGHFTREQAFQEFLANGGLDNVARESAPSIPDAVFEREDLTLDNFGQVTLEVTGKTRRFRVSSSQSDRIRAGELTRAQAFAEYVEERRNAIANSDNEVAQEVMQ